MSLRLIKPKRTSPDAEDIFLAHYERVSAWALHLTDHDRTRAEDLTHDLFVQLALNPPDYDRIENFENYLFIVLRNLHRFQRKKEARVNFLQKIPITDFDSAETGLHAVVNFDNQMQVRQELEIACRYACERKETSRAGSVFILRFFHGYFPSEIARILCGSRPAIGELLRVARAEVRAVLENPEKIRFFKSEFAESNSAAYKPEAMIENLREQIFSARTGECLAENRLADIYEIGSAELIDRARLAHFVSCARCLERINKILNLEDLSNRFPPDNLGADGGGKAKKKSSAASDKQKSLENFRRRLQAVREHEPRELWVAANGVILGSQPVAAKFNEQTLGLEAVEKIEFVEVYSEQNVRLCALNVEQPPAGDFEQTAQIAFGDDRNLQINLSFCGNWRNVKVIYLDEHFGFCGSPHEVKAQNTQVSNEFPPAEKDTLTSRVFPQTGDEPPKFSRRFLNWTFEKFAPFGKLEFWTCPTIITFLIAAPLVALLIFWRVSLDETVLPNSKQIINQTIAAEKNLAPDAGNATKQLVEIEEKTDGTTTARYRLEIWRREQTKENFYTAARRVSNETGKIIAGEWQKADGTRHRKTTEKTVLPEAVWNDFSIHDFDRTSDTKVSDAGNFYVLENADSSLKIRKADYRVTEKTVRVENGLSGEFRFVETAFEKRAAREIPDEVFNPNSIGTNAPLELIKPVEKDAPQIETSPANANQNLETNANFAAAKPANKPLATAELELEALNLLSAARGDLNEQITVGRTANGILRVGGIVETAARKNEIVNALAPIAKNPAVEIQIKTVAEAVAEQQKKKSSARQEITLEQKDADGFSIAAEDDLRFYFSRRGIADAQIETEIRRFSQEMFARSRRVAQHAGALRQIAARFSPAEIENLTPKAKSDFLALIKKHARNLQTETAALRGTLAPVFGGNSGGAGGKINTADIRAAATQIVSLTGEIDRQIRAAFSASTDKRAAQTLKTQNFWTNLQRVEQTAAALADD